MDYELTNTKRFHVKLIHKHPIMAESVMGDVIAVFKHIPKGTSKGNIVKLKKRVLISDMFWLMFRLFCMSFR